MRAIIAVLTFAAVSASNHQGVDVFKHGEANYSCFRIPSFLRLPGGQLAVFCEGRKLSCNDHGLVDIVYKTSADGGATWSPLGLVYSNSTATKQVTVGNPSPVVISGQVLLLFCRNNREIFMLRSSDGLSWNGPPTEITTAALGPARAANVSWIATGPPQGLVVHGQTASEADRILIQANYRGAPTAGKDVGLALISDDGGKSWRPSKGLVPACNEGQIAPAQNGSLLMNCRTAGYHRLLSYSDDRG